MKACTLMKRVILTSFRSREEFGLLRSGMTPAANDPERAENRGGKRDRRSGAGREDGLRTQWT